MMEKRSLSFKLYPVFTLIILLAGAAWIRLSAAEAGSTTSGSIPAPRPGFLAPDFSLPTGLGEVITLSGLRGRPILINIWASWCRPCRAEMPAIQEVYAAYQKQGFVVLGVNATQQDSQAAALAFAQEMGLSFPILLDQEGEVTRLYETRAFPTSFFIDEQGIVREVVVGGPMAEALLRIRVEQLAGPVESGLPQGD
jgi:peroxiredoxin